MTNDETPRSIVMVLVVYRESVSMRRKSGLVVTVRPPHGLIVCEPEEKCVYMEVGT